MQKSIPYDILKNQELEGGLWLDPVQLQEHVLRKRVKPGELIDYSLFQHVEMFAPVDNPANPVDLKLESVPCGITVSPFREYYLIGEANVPFGMRCHWTDEQMIQEIKNAMTAPTHMVPGEGNEAKIQHPISDRLKKKYIEMVEDLHVAKVIDHHNELLLRFTHGMFCQINHEGEHDVPACGSIADFVSLVMLFFLNIPPRYRTNCQMIVTEDVLLDPCPGAVES